MKLKQYCVLEIHTSELDQHTKDALEPLDVGVRLDISYCANAYPQLWAMAMRLRGTVDYIVIEE